MINSINFKDPQGQTWTDAVIRVINFSVSINRYISVGHDSEFTPTEQIGGNSHYNTQIVYWPTQESFDEGLVPYVLKRAEGENFEFSVEAIPADLTELESLCEQYVEDVLIPTMQ